jgi:proteasome lid subunit RPN8/RPN11
LLVLPKKFTNEIIAHALRDDPNECCGILASKDGSVTKLFHVTNVENSPYRYSMDPKELLSILREIDDHKWDLLAVYHSHTHSPAYPSDTDVRLASLPDAYYILVSLENKENPVIRCFRIVDQAITEEESTIA